jgi:hypothetical protein
MMMPTCSTELGFANTNLKQLFMKKLLATLAIIASAAMPAGATPQSPDYHNGGQCAGDQYSKCRYTLEIVKPNEPMVLIPELKFLGLSRISTVEHCAELEYIADWKNMMTDEELWGMEACLIEHT